MSELQNSFYIFYPYRQWHNTLYILPLPPMTQHSIYSTLTANDTTLDVKICYWLLRTRVLKRILWDNISKLLKVITTLPRCCSASSLCKLSFVNCVYLNFKSGTFGFYFGYFLSKFQIYALQYTYTQRGKLIILNNCFM
jgi:hypothetical protein